MREEIKGLSLYFVFSDFFYKGNLNVILKLYSTSLKKGFFSGQLSFDNVLYGSVPKGTLIACFLMSFFRRFDFGYETLLEIQ